VLLASIAEKRARKRELATEPGVGDTA